MSPTRAKWRSDARGRDDLQQALIALGAKIRELRVERELTLEKLAEASRLTPNHLQAVEAGTTHDSIERSTSL